MAIENLLVTVDFDKLSSKATEDTEVNIGRLLEKVPTARIVDGDPRVAVRVRVDQRQHQLLLAAVDEFCLVDTYADLDLY